MRRPIAIRPHQDLRRRHDDNAARVEIDHRNHLAGEGIEFDPAARHRDFDQVAGAEILHRAHRADFVPRVVDRFQADQIGMVEFFLLGRRQTVPVDIQLDAAQRLRRVAVGHAVDAGQHLATRNAGRLEAELPRAGHIGNRPIGHHAIRFLGKALHAHLTPHPMGAGDHRDTDLTIRHFRLLLHSAIPD